MILVYLIGRYIAIYGFPSIIINHTLKIIIISLSIVFIFNSIITDVLREQKDLLNHFLRGNGGIIMPFSRDNNVLTIIASVSCLYIFLQYQFQSNIVNYCASFVFSIYIIHSSVLFMLNTPSNDAFYLYFITNLFLMIIGCFIIEVVRRYLLGKIFNQIEILEIKLFDKLSSKF